MSDKNEIKRYSSARILDEFQISQRLDAFIGHLLDENSRINLVSRETSAENLKSIAADCLVPFKYMPPPDGRILDIGSGGGFPALVLLLAFNGLRGDLIERTIKKANYLRRAVKLFDLRANIIDKDFLEYSHQIGEGTYNVATMKLVRPEARIFRQIAFSLATSGKFIYYGDLKKVIFPYERHFSAVSYSYYLDESEHLHHFTIFSKR